MRTEFKSLDEMTEEELQTERDQLWVITKSSDTWWLHRNHSAFMPVTSEAEGKAILQRYGITKYGINRSQPEVTLKQWEEFRRDKMRVMAGHSPSFLRRVWRRLGGDAA